MLNYTKIKNKPRILRNLTGLSPEGFRQLVSAFERAYDQELAQMDSLRPQARQRERGGGRQATLATMADKLLFILLYFKLYPIQELLGFLFGLSQAQANEWVHRLTPVLKTALGYEKQLSARKTQDIKQVLAECPGLEFIIDGTERPIQRPQAPGRQQDYYSGKKKRHTVKNNVISHKPTKKIKVLSPTVPGRTHDKKLADEDNYAFPPGSHLWQDTGFQGYEPAQVLTYQPKKKPRGGELTPTEKEQNHAISQERIGVEHSIGGVKVFRIARDIYRNHKDGFEDLIMCQFSGDNVQQICGQAGPVVVSNDGPGIFGTDDPAKLKGQVEKSCRKDYPSEKA